VDLLKYFSVPYKKKVKQVWKNMRVSIYVNFQINYPFILILNYQSRLFLHISLFKY